MPLNGYFKGRGNQVMQNMQSEYGAKKGKSVFYELANKTGMKPKGPSVAGMSELARPTIRKKLP